MARIGKTIGGRIIRGVLLVHLLILPALYFGLVFLLKQSNEELFLNSARGHARYIADTIERIGDSASDLVLTEILDSVVVSGNGVFAELIGESREIRSSLNNDADVAKYKEDFSIGENADHTYFISMPVTINQSILFLRVGFDESPFHEQNIIAYRNGLAIIALYLVVLLVLLPIIARRVVRPVKAIQTLSREIASGAFSENLAIKTDIVEFQELSRDLDHMKNRLLGISEELEQQIREREAAELARHSLEQQLRHSQRLETVGTMAGGIAHELNNILLPIILYTDMAIEDLPADSPARDDIRRVKRAASRAKNIVNQVLTFSRKMATIEYQPIDMAHAVRETVELLRASLPASAKVEIDIDEHTPAVLGDAPLMNQLILNLCTNAVQSLRDSSGKVLIRLGVTEVNDELRQRNPNLGSDRCVCVSVHDDGLGMDPQTIDRIFEPFFTTRGVGEGTGLGLSVVHGIVVDLCGAIDVESTVESGSTFSVYLPIAQQTTAYASDNNAGQCCNDENTID